jgi:PII-like signaling protein
MKRYKLLKIVVGEDAVYKGKSLYVALVARLKELGAAGATVTSASWI